MTLLNRSLDHVETRRSRQRVPALRRSAKNLRVYLLILLAVLSSCQERGGRGTVSEESARLKEIVGTWKSEPVDGGRRERFIVMTFTRDGRVIDYSVKFTDSDSGKVSGTIPMEGTYRISDGIIHWTIDGGKAEIPYSIEGATMRQTLGREKYTFKRQAEQVEDDQLPARARSKAE